MQTGSALAAIVSRLGSARKNDATRPGRGFAADTQGATTIEFAFVLVPFFALLFSVFENGLLLMSDDGLAQANSSSARQVMIGAVQKDTTITTAAQYLDKLICHTTDPTNRVLPSYIDCSTVVVDIQALPPTGSFSSVNQGSDFYTVAGTNKYCTGSASGIVMVRLMYPMPAYFPILSQTFLAASGTNTAGLTTINGKLVHVVLSTAVFKVEPFGSGGVVLPGC